LGLLATTAQSAHDDLPAQARLHARVAKARSEILGTLYGGWMANLPNADLLLKLHGRIAACGRGASLYQDNATGRLVQVSMPCNSRLCPKCMISRAKDSAARVRKAIDKMDSPRLLTLTLASTDKPLGDEIDRLRKSFRECRRSNGWRDHVQGGVTVFECTFEPQTGRWHPHLHCVIDATYWAQKDVSDAWQKATGDSKIVDIRMIHSKERAANYVSKYLSKSPDINACPPEKRCEWAAAMHGGRLVQTFGSLHGATLKPEKTPRPEGMRHIVYAGALLAAIVEGDVEALGLNNRLQAISWSTQDNADTHEHRDLAECLIHWSQKRLGDEPDPPGETIFPPERLFGREPDG
jgi:hypothetical protein